uniref:BTB domain-containing protein n=1 Tax=Heterorhabditis bacteriophora TaxID=37862 RepID=A0A1I7X388_HETBA
MAIAQADEMDVHLLSPLSRGYVQLYSEPFSTHIGTLLKRCRTILDIWRKKSGKLRRTYIDKSNFVGLGCQCFLNSANLSADRWSVKLKSNLCCASQDLEIVEDTLCQKVFPAFLRFMYCNHVVLHQENCLPILILADKYNVISLKKMIEILKSNQLVVAIKEKCSYDRKVMMIFCLHNFFFCKASFAENLQQLSFFYAITLILGGTSECQFRTNNFIRRVCIQRISNTNLSNIYVDLHSVLYIPPSDLAMDVKTRWIIVFECSYGFGFPYYTTIVILVIDSLSVEYMLSIVDDKKVLKSFSSKKNFTKTSELDIDKKVEINDLLTEDSPLLVNGELHLQLTLRPID